MELVLKLLKLIKIILIIIIISILSIIYKYLQADNVDRKAFYYSILSYNKLKKSDSTFYYKLSHLLKLMGCPIIFLFNNTDKLILSTNGIPYGTYINTIHPKIAHNFSDKLWWNFIFQKYDINHPKIVCINGEKKFKINNKTTYIIKRRYGMFSSGQYKIKGKRLKKKKKSKCEWFAQEFIDHRLLKDLKHYRLITLYNGDVLSLIEIVEKYTLPMEISRIFTTSNICKNEKCTDVTKIQQKSLDDIIIKLKNLHKKIGSKIVSIGWDLIFDYNNDKIYVLEGNTSHAHYWNMKSKNELKNFKKIVKKFYKEQGLI